MLASADGSGPQRPQCFPQRNRDAWELPPETSESWKESEFYPAGASKFAARNVEGTPLGYMGERFPKAHLMSYIHMERSISRFGGYVHNQ